MKKNYSIVRLVHAFIIITSAFLFPVTAHSQDLTAEQKQERCQNNKNRIAALKEQLIVIDAELSQNKKPELINKKNEINKQLAIHRNRLIALGCDNNNNNSILSGKWACSDGGIYTITQNGNNIVWEGISSDGKSWAHTFEGEIKDDIIVGTFKDHFPGTTKNSGPLTIKIISNNRLEKQEQGSEKVFGGSVWTR